MSRYVSAVCNFPFSFYFYFYPSRNTIYLSITFSFAKRPSRNLSTNFYLSQNTIYIPISFSFERCPSRNLFTNFYLSQNPIYISIFVFFCRRISLKKSLAFYIQKSLYTFFLHTPPHQHAQKKEDIHVYGSWRGFSQTIALIRHFSRHTNISKQRILVEMHEYREVSINDGR